MIKFIKWVFWVVGTLLIVCMLVIKATDNDPHKRRRGHK
jgi:hypothetical protein